ncbi:MAG: methyltransferase domain-containing protein [Bacteroidota bacterium]
MTQNSHKFNYNQIPLGFYDRITQKRKGMRSFWHNQKFKRVIDSIEKPLQSILDIGCFSGTFLSLIPPQLISQQTGVDILQQQIEFANTTYGAPFRKFYCIKNLKEVEFLPNQSFNFVTIIEVVEHLTPSEISDLIQLAYTKLRTGGRLVITTPNYRSLWPLQEFVLNKISDVKYQEQHITHFHYFNIRKKLSYLVNNFHSMFRINYVTTTHAFTPYIAMFSYTLAEKIASAIPHRKWAFPLGSLLLVELTKI